MPAKPFVLTFEYTPRWKSNRSRDAAEQFHVTMRDLQESRRIVEQERIVKKLSEREKKIEGLPVPDRPQAPELIISMTGERVELVYDLVRRHLVAFDPFQVEDDQGQVRDIRTFEDMREHCSDVVAELGQRLLNGPDADELKN